MIKCGKFIFLFILLLSKTLFAQENYLTEEILHYNFWKPYHIKFIEDKKGISFKVLYLDERHKTSVTDEQKQNYSKKIQDSLENNKCYLNLYAGNDVTKRYYYEGKIEWASTETIMAGKPTAYKWINIIYFDIKTKHLKSECELNCKIINNYEGALNETISCKSPIILKITSEPSGAKIFLDGQDTETITPDLFPNIINDSIRVQLTKDGYQDTLFTVELTDFENKEIEVELRKSITDTEKKPWYKHPLFLIGAGTAVVATGVIIWCPWCEDPEPVEPDKLAAPPYWPTLP